MIGLVVTSTASWVQQIIQKLGLRKSELLSLRDELALRRVATYPLEKVRQFQKAYRQKEIDANRALPWAGWEQLSVSEYRAFSKYIPTFNPIPSDIQETIGKVRTIPKAKVFVERFCEDPFVFISNSGGKETYCIGYWDTRGFQS